MNLDITSGYDAARSLARADGGQKIRNQVKGLAVNPLRERVGEIVGQVFFGTLLKQMQASKLKTDYFRGGRGEEVFQGQLGMELAMRAGRAPGNALTERLYASFARRYGDPAATASRESESPANVSQQLKSGDPK